MARPSNSKVATTFHWLEGVAWVALAGLLGVAARPWSTLADQAMVLLLAVVIAATRLGRGPALLASLTSVAAFNFLFVPPYYTFAVADLRHVFTFGVMFGVGLLVTQLTQRIREQAAAASARERRTAALYAMTREFAHATDPEAIANAAARSAGEQLEARTTWSNGQDAARGGALQVPLAGTRGTLGVLRVDLGARELTDEERAFLDTLASTTTLALERATLAVDNERGRLAVETERLRSELLSAVSHDLRTPLASISGGASALLAQDLTHAQRELLLTIREEGERLGRLVADLLELTRIESGSLEARREWYPIEEVIAGAVGRLEATLDGRQVTVDVPASVLEAPMDPTLIEQVLVNLLENAVKYSPIGTPIDLVARPEEGAVRVEVADRGAGIPAGTEDRLFERFFRAADGHRAGGAGLGLAICRAILKAHKGRIVARNRDGGGAVFAFWLPLGDASTA